MSDEWYDKGYNFNYGINTEIDYKKALICYKIAGDLGNAKSWNNIGNLYHEGLGVKQNFTIAYKYYSMAINNNYSYSYLNIGHMYLEGLYVDQSVEKAICCYERAGKLKNYEGYFFIGELYYHGTHIKQDINLAHKYFKLAEPNNDKCTFTYLGLINLQNKNYEEALKYFDKLSDDYDAYYYIGLTYEKSGDLNNAIINYEKADELENLEATFRLAKIYQCGAIKKIEKLNY